MPRRLDVAARERLVVDAAIRVIARDGVTSLSVRNVAAEADLAPSSLRYSFPSQAVLREKALHAIGERTRARIDALPAELDGPEWAAAALCELLPLDAERRLEMQLYLDLGTAAMADRSLIPFWEETADEAHEVCALALEAVGVPVDRAATDHLHALVDGLALHLLLSATTRDPQWALDVIHQALERAS